MADAVSGLPPRLIGPYAEEEDSLRLRINPVLIGKEIAETLLQSRHVSCPAFPDHEDSPPHAFQGPHILPVPINIPLALLLPEFLVGRRSNPTVPAAVFVPEAAVDKDHLAMTRQYNIRRARQLSLVQAEPVSHAMNNPAHDDFGLRVLASNARHAVPVLFSIQHIRHEYESHKDACTSSQWLSKVPDLCQNSAHVKVRRSDAPDIPLESHSKGLGEWACHCAEACTGS